jgi:hypothetical protein
MSEAEGLVGAETFAAVSPRNNGKLAADLNKLVLSPEITHRYVFFYVAAISKCGALASVRARWRASVERDRLITPFV